MDVVKISHSYYSVDSVVYKKWGKAATAAISLGVGHCTPEKHWSLLASKNLELRTTKVSALTN